MDDDRIEQLIDLLEKLGDGFANNIVMRPELLDLLREVKAAREKPKHCPGCDGDHL